MTTLDIAQIVFIVVVVVLGMGLILKVIIEDK